MAWYCVYQTTTGASVSFTSDVPTDLPVGLNFVAIADQPVVGQSWDAASLSVVDYDPVPANPTGALYEEPAPGGRWLWTYAIGTFRLPASANGARSAQPADAIAQAYIRANASPSDVSAAIGWAAARRDSLGLALTAAGADPATNATYQAASAVLAFLGGCL